MRWRGIAAALCAAVAITGLLAPGPASSDSGIQDEPLVEAGQFRDPDLVDEGRRIYLDTCSSCHGEDARGIPERGPSLREAGEAAADFYLRTNRMPLDDPEDQPSRHPHNVLSVPQKVALVVYIGTFGGPPVPDVDPEGADVSRGQTLFTEHCAGCHQTVARGGIAPQARIPDLEGVAPIDVAEAMLVGPYVMPEFQWLDDQQVDEIAAYVEYAQDPEDRGGWGIGHIGPVPEGIVTWFLAGAALLLIIRIIGERTTE